MLADHQLSRAADKRTIADPSAPPDPDRAEAQRLLQHARKRLAILMLPRADIYIIAKCDIVFDAGRGSVYRALRPTSLSSCFGPEALASS